jgi:hypothetical protein
MFAGDHNMKKIGEKILNDQGLVSFWDFQETTGRDRIDSTKNGYILKEMAGPIQRAEDGVFGPYSANMEEGKWFSCPRKECPELNIHGKDAKITVIAWVKRVQKSNNHCEAVAGMWNEEECSRQYCLFLNLTIHNSFQSVCGHISSVGGSTPGQKWCMDASIGSTPVPLGEWQCIAFTYDGTYAKSYLNGKLDAREVFNPYFYDEGIRDGGENGSDFTVGAVYRLGEMGNWYVGLLGGLAVYNRVLDENEMAEIGWKFWKDRA